MIGPINRRNNNQLSHTPPLSTLLSQSFSTEHLIQNLMQLPKNHLQPYDITSTTRTPCLGTRWTLHLEQGSATRLPIKLHCTPSSDASGPMAISSFRVQVRTVAY
ncbi:Sphingoid long-chain base transporter RSB1 [Fusarium oxysporum f. sp. albedinis]|nr:Sphingoid long-chain base transporter RSB1 [Fusarium oxysporum f. sp. albedinis]